MIAPIRAAVVGGHRGVGYRRALAAMPEKVVLSAVCDRSPEVLEQARQTLAREAKGKIVAISGDVSKAEDCARIFDAAEKELGRVDVLLNNAGTHSNGPFEAATDKIWQDDFDLKLFSTIRLTRAALPGMKARKWGRIINVLNTGAKWPRHGSAPTSVTRAAGMALMAPRSCGCGVRVGSSMGPRRSRAIASGYSPTRTAIA